MIARRISQAIQRRLAADRAVALIGPRQSGKTTLAKPLPGSYFDLEQEADRLGLDLQWIDLLLDSGKERWAVGIQLTSHPGENDMNRLSRVAQTVGASRSFLVSQTRESAEGKGRAWCNLPWLIEWPEQEFAHPKR
ncbi:MAG: hypothetical protein PHO07_11620 [Pirellulales bacterium]|jgi:GTPase SAR1 family protein|nr:hypothetical protein [Thermoguttaceae bacterium]MDD4787814.1 hypothetical protein [Pirellulales bacterium]MDI9443602.1 hypothetical protein [Planctomycetota bacterium]NLZ00263.1 hypothetical protein [Pirellulaceae bacterium]